MSLSEQQIATLTTRLAEAEAARHRLMTGALQVAVEYDGYRQNFAQADVAKLDAYIAELRRDLGIEPPEGRRRRAIRVAF